MANGGVAQLGLKRLGVSSLGIARLGISVPVIPTWDTYAPYELKVLQEDASRNLPVVQSGCHQSTIATPIGTDTAIEFTGLIHGGFSVPQDNLLPINGNWKVYAYVRFKAMPTVAARFFARNPHASYSFNFGIIKDGGVWKNHFYIADGAAAIAMTKVQLSTQPVIDTWYFFEASKKDGVITFSMNGVAVQTLTTAYGITDWGTEGMGLGSYNNADYFLDGYMCAVGMESGNGDAFTPSSLPTDPIVPDKYTVLAINGDGDNASQRILDSAKPSYVTGHLTIPATGATLDTSFSKYGGSCLGILNNSAARVGIEPNAATDFPDCNEEFTCQFWYRCDSNAGNNRSLIGQGDSGGGSASIPWWIRVYTNNKVQFQVTEVGPTHHTAESTTLVDASPTQWTHIAACMDGEVARLYINGVQEATFDTTGKTMLSATLDQLGIGSIGEYVGGLFGTGQYDLIQIDKECLYPDGTSFTPPVEPLDITSNTVIQYNCAGADGSTDIEDSTENTETDSDAVPALQPDDSGNEKDATVNGDPLWSAFDGLLTLDGTGDFLSNAAFAPSLPITVTMKPVIPATISASATLFGEADCLIGIADNLVTGYSVSFQTSGEAGTETTLALEGTTPVIAVEIGTSTQKAYVNGVLVKTWNFSPSIAAYGIGARNDGNSPFTGAFDDVIVAVRAGVFDAAFNTFVTNYDPDA